jgi:hypothetical protein
LIFLAIATQAQAVAISPLIIKAELNPGESQTQTITLFNSPYYTNVTISGTGTKSLQNATQTFINEDLNINGSILLVNTNEVLTVRRALKIATVVTTDIPDFQINNNGQLIQIEETDTNSGTRFQLTRNYTATNVDYIYWGSPTKLYAVSNLPGGFRYEWNPVFSNSNLIYNGKFSKSKLFNSLKIIYSYSY